MKQGILLLFDCLCTERGISCRILSVPRIYQFPPNFPKDKFFPSECKFIMSFLCFLISDETAAS